MRSTSLAFDPRRSTPVLLLFWLCLLGSLSPAGGATGVELGPCEPGLVRHRHEDARLVLAAAPGQPEPPADTASLEWLGHSSFLLTSPQGVRVLTDPNGLHPVPTTPDLVTVSNLHGTHTAVRQVPTAPRVLWGINPDGTWNQLALTLRDLSLFNLPSYASRTNPESSPVHNSIFVFRAGNLCVVHLGNLRHPLTRQQLQRIGKPDVVLIPADGQWTMPYDDALTVIQQLQPQLVVPMHLDFAEHAEVFVQYTGERYPVRRLPGHTLPLGRHLLPASTEIVVFRGPDRFTPSTPTVPSRP